MRLNVLSAAAGQDMRIKRKLFSGKTEQRGKNQEVVLVSAGVMDCWREEKDLGESNVWRRAEAELQPLGQGEQCALPVEIKILQLYCYHSSARHGMHILFDE